MMPHGGGEHVCLPGHQRRRRSAEPGGHRRQRHVLAGVAAARRCRQHWSLLAVQQDPWHGACLDCAQCACNAASAARNFLLCSFFYVGPSLRPAWARSGARCPAAGRWRSASWHRGHGAGHGLLSPGEIQGLQRRHAADGPLSLNGAHLGVRDAITRFTKTAHCPLREHASAGGYLPCPHQHREQCRHARLGMQGMPSSQQLLPPGIGAGDNPITVSGCHPGRAMQW